MLNADRVWYFWTVPDLSVSDAFDYGGGTTCLRLAFSAVPAPRIREGIERLGAVIAS